MQELLSKNKYDINDLLKVMRILRGENGCPWDREQDHHSIRNNFIEETYEVVEAIDTEDLALLQEELGDVLLQVVFHAQFEEEKGNFGFDEVCDGICKKLIYRHPHVFKDEDAGTPEESILRWDEMKRLEKKQDTTTEYLQQVASSLPALMRAQKVAQRAGRRGYTVPEEYLFDALAQLLTQLREASPTERSTMWGDFLYLTTMLAGKQEISAEETLSVAVNHSIECCRRIETASETEPNAALGAIDCLWQKAKEFSNINQEEDKNDES